MRVALVPPFVAAAVAATAGLQRSPSVDVRTMTFASHDDVELRLDLYLPANPIRRPAPVVVFVHGGGWPAAHGRPGAG